MSLLDEKTAWTIAATGAAIVGAMAARSALKAGWKAFMATDPPENPADPAVTWGEAIAWTALTGAVVGVARMCAQRVAVSGWEKATGHTPPDYT